MTQVKEIPESLRALLGDHKPPVSPDLIKRVLREYGDRMSAGDAVGTAALFSPDAVIYDPVESPGRRGDEIRQFYQGAFDASGGFIEMRLEGEVRVSGRYGAAAYLARMTMAGNHVVVRTLDVMKFDDDGRIVSMHAYWGPSNIEISERPPERLK
jgi:steroid delta-isomerase